MIEREGNVKASSRRGPRVARDGIGCEADASGVVGGGDVNRRHADFQAVARGWTQRRRMALNDTPTATFRVLTKGRMYAEYRSVTLRTRNNSGTVTRLAAGSAGAHLRQRWPTTLTA